MRARNYGSNIEMHYCAQLSEAIATDMEGDEAEFRRLAIAAITDCGRASYLDGLVFAYRVHPRLINAGQGDPEALNVLRKALTLGRDNELARRAGVEIRPGELNEPLEELTAREREVLGLLLEGLTNIEIGKRLFISPSTAKVHVRHILGKLGVRTRLQAVIRAQELLDSERTY
jgi:ATP/maltotriose-dependent transcriptional regulator MalT